MKAKIKVLEQNGAYRWQMVRPGKLTTISDERFASVKEAYKAARMVRRYDSYNLNREADVGESESREPYLW